MPRESDVKKLGRVEYIEPNSLFTKGEVQNGIPQPYEDYSFSVNLRVINGNRYDCGMTSQGDDIATRTLEFSSDRGTISFMNGTEAYGEQGYLTTNFTDISMNDPATNTKECLGIESISIKYSSWYTPTVDIRFVDVRGASLMQPSEYEYYNNGGPNVGKNDSVTSNSDFFKAFFTFPYPLFRLSVKGFYGKEVTYDLSVVKCNIEFDSQAGNFVANASFIGYMYGMYADLPFPFAYIAPYIDLYGKNTWEEKKGTGDFCYLTSDKNNPVGRQMYTFPELKVEVKNAGQKADKQIEENPTGKRVAALQKLHDKLNNQVNPYYPTSGSKYYWWSWSKADNGRGFFFVPAEDSPKANRYIFNDFLKFSKALFEYNDMVKETENYQDQGIIPQPIFDGIYKDAMKVDHAAVSEEEQQQLNKEGLSDTVKYTDEDIKSILAGRIVTIHFHKDVTDKNNPVLVYDSNKSDYGTASESDYMDLIKSLQEKFKNMDAGSPIQYNTADKEWTLKAFILDNIKYREKIIDTLNHIGSELNKYVQERDRLREQMIDDALGFNPSMKNLYNMIFAHIDTFMSVYYNTLDRIRKSLQSDSDTSRTKETLCGPGIQVDVNDNTLKSPSSYGGKLPPFTMFYREETEKDSKDRKVTMIWPGELPGGKNLEEVKLVEAIINATSLSKRSMETVTPRDNVILKEGELVPTNYYDLIKKQGNPYLDILNDKSLLEDDIVKLVMQTFALRTYYSMLNGSYLETNTDGSVTETTNLTEKAKLVAKLEVSNVERAFELLGMKPTQNFKTQLMQLSENGSELVSEFMKGDKPMFTSSPAKEVGVDGQLAYNWIKQPGTDTYLLPVRTFNPTVLANAVNGIVPSDTLDNFVQLQSDGTLTTPNSCKIFGGSGYLQSVFTKNSTGDFAQATRLFPGYKSPSDVKVHTDRKYKLPSLISSRKTEAGVTSVFMDPLYYAQKSVQARAYMFLMGVQFGEDKTYFLPETIGNMDYPTLLLLREGAAYWRNEQLGNYNDPITYYYEINGVTYNALKDIEANDPAFGVRYVETSNNKLPKNASVARKTELKKYFLKWATGNGESDTPSPSADFQSIERTFGLWGKEDGSMVNKFLANMQNGPYLSIASSGVGAYQNSEVLRSVYNVGSDGSLGKVKGNIREDVFILDTISEDKLPDSTKTFLAAFRKFYYGNTSIIDYSTLDKPNASYTVPRAPMNVAMSEFVKGLKESNNVSVEQLKKNGGTGSLGEEDDSYTKPEQFRDRDLKLACYIALKNLYDRWLCSRRRESWYFTCKPGVKKVNGIGSDFRRFFYIDEFYHNIGMQIRPNLTDFVERMSSEGGFSDKSDEFDLEACSILKMLSTTAQYGGCALLTLPTMLGLARTYDDDRNSISDVFKAFPYNDAVRGNDIETSFIVLYSNQKSSVLDCDDQTGEKNAYKTDGFDIANTWGEIVPQAMFTDSDDDGYVVPCFGVTFAKQNQSYFSNVRLSMEDHQITEYSIRNEVMISYANNRGPRETTVVGQDLYSVFSNYSYSCSVEMLGDAQITPLMYFQLNNIAMWKGAYLVTEVSHDISASGFRTVFKGTRQARPSLPFKDGKMINEANGAAQQTAYSQENPGTDPAKDATSMSERVLDKINVDDVVGIAFYLDRTTVNEDETWVDGTLRVSVAYKNGDRVDYDNIATTKEAIHGMEKNMWDNTPEQNRAVFSLPQGIFNYLRLETPRKADEFRDPNDSFYKFTEGMHIVVSDDKYAIRKAEIITGDPFYTLYESGGFKDISIGDISPIMIFGAYNGDYLNWDNEDEIHATYRQIFDLVRRMNEAKKPLSFVVGTKATIDDAKLDED